MKELQITFSNKSDRLSLLTFLCNYGFTGYYKGNTSTNPVDIDSDALFTVWPVVVVDLKSKTIDYRRNTHGVGEVFNWPSQAAEIVNAVSSPLPRKVKLNETYTAEVNKSEKTVTVGCQTIPFYAIEELYKSIQDA